MSSRSLSTLCACAALLLGAAVPAGAATLPPGFTEQTMVSGLTRPMDVAWAPDGRMFVIQKDGLLLVVPPGSTRAVRVQDFSPIVNGQNDRGLLGLAVDADFAANRYVYLLFTYDIDPPGPGERESSGGMVSQLLRLRVGPLNQVMEQTAILGTDVDGPCPAPDQRSRLHPVRGDHPLGRHGAGRSRRQLWVGSGDGFSEEAEFPRRAPTTRRAWPGRSFTSTATANGLEGHPFCPGENDLAWSARRSTRCGFRNPFRFTLRPGGGLVVGDVGWTAARRST